MKDEGWKDKFYAVAFIVIAPFLVLASPFFLLYKTFKLITGTPLAEEKKARALTTVLYESAQGQPKTSADEWALAVGNHIGGVPDDLVDYLIEATFQLYKNENFELPPPPPVANSVEGARYRDQLAKRPDMARGARVLAEAYKDFLALVPDEPETSALSFPGRLSNIAKSAMVNAVIFPFYRDSSRDLFEYTRRQFDRNLHEVSDIPFTYEFLNSSKLILPDQYKGDNITYAYLKDTPFLRLFDAPYRFAIPQKAREEHCFIVGGTGHGKTTMLETMLMHDLNQHFHKQAPSIVLIDSQGQLIEKLSRLGITMTLNVILIDPRDNPTLNIFDINHERMKNFGETEREQVYNQTLETFRYLFNSLLGAELTVKQATMFNYLIALMLALPQAIGRNATLLDLLKVLDKNIPTEYYHAIATLDPVAQGFFEHDFVQKGYDHTKEEIRYRLQALLGNKTLARLFLAPKNTVDFFEEMNKGAIILFDTSKAHLGATNSQYLGRIAVTMVVNAILARGATKPPYKPIHVYIDEAQEVFDKGVETFLMQARKYRAGLVLATQDLAHMTNELRSSVISNTSIKFAGGVSSQDARALASDMRTNYEFIMDQKKLNFACYVKNQHHAAVSVEVEVGAFDKDVLGYMDDDFYKYFREQNRNRVSAPVATTHEVGDVAEEKPADEEIVTEKVAPKKPSKARSKAPLPPGGARNPNSDW